MIWRAMKLDVAVAAGQRKMILITAAVMILMYATLFRGQGGGLMMMVVGYMLVSIPFTIADRADIDVMYATVPLTRRSVVDGRYLMALVILGVAALAEVALQAVLSLAGLQPMPSVASSAIVLTGLGACLLAVAIQFVFFFKWGYAQARWTLLVPIVIIAGIAGPVMASETATSFLAAHLPGVLVGAAAVILLALAGSLLLSRRIYEHRQL